MNPFPHDRRPQLILGDQRGRSGFGTVIALLLGGLFLLMVAQGATMIDGVKAFLLAREVENIQAAMRSFEDRFDALPGDNDEVGRVLGREPARAFARGRFYDLTENGRIDGLFFDFASPEAETYAAWRDLRAAGFVGGDATLFGTAAMPETPFGGVMGFSEHNLGLTDVLCMTEVPGKAARTVDGRLDDGLPGTGLVRARMREIDPILQSIFDAPGDGDYGDDQRYMLCIALRNQRAEAGAETDAAR